MRRAFQRPKRGENSGPGKEVYGELDARPGIREQPRPAAAIAVLILRLDITLPITQLAMAFSHLAFCK